MRSKVAFLVKINQIIAENLDNPALKGAFIAQSLGMSRMHLHRLLKQTVQENARTFIIEKRIHHAKIQLQTTTKYVYQIAQEVGYSDSKHFAKVFKKRVGQTPSQFRKSKMM